MQTQQTTRGCPPLIRALAHSDQTEIESGLQLAPLDYFDKSGKYITDALQLDLVAYTKPILVEQRKLLSAIQVKNPQIRTIEDYWAFKGWPTDKESRIEIAQKLRDNQPLNFAEPFLTFGPKELDDHGWLNVLACHIDNPNNGNPYFNGNHAYQLFLHAARLGSWSAARNIAIKYAYGHERPIDSEKGIFWFRKAFESGHGCSGAEVYNWDIQDPRYGHPDHQEFTDKVDGIADKMFEMGAPWGVLTRARYIAGGRTTANDIDYALYIYEQFIGLKDEMCGPPVMNSAWAMALRYFLGLETPLLETENHRAHVKKYLDILPRESNDTNIKYGLRWKADLLEQVLTKAVAQPTLYEDALSIVYKMRDGLLSLEDFDQSINQGAIEPSDALLETLWAAAQLSENEGWKIQPGYFYAAQIILFKQLNINYQDLVRSRLVMGPRYNALDEQGHHILGCFAEASKSEAQMQEEYRHHGSFVPMPGIRALKGIRTDKAGNINFVCDVSSTEPALLLEEDFDVCLSLVFGKAAENQWPSLSLEPIRISPIKDELSGVNKKVWDPAWIGQTDFGRTLMITDYMMGQLVWNYKNLCLISPDTPEAEDLNQLANDLLQRIDVLGGRTGHAQSGRVMIKPQKFKFETTQHQEFLQKHTYKVMLEKARMTVDGAYWSRDIHGNEDRSVSLNDSTYRNGRVANFLTSEFATVSTLLPAFERYRQMMILLQGLVALKDAGWKPNKELQRNIDQKHQAFLALPPLSHQHTYCI